MLSKTRADELFSYDTKSGHLVRKIRPANSVKIGDIAGSTALRGSNLCYLEVHIDNVSYLVHRVIWLIVTGCWPRLIDHINGDGVDNRWINLREVNHQNNSKNMRLNNKNKAGLLGVYWSNKHNKWAASICNDGKSEHLYWGPCFFEACCRRKSAELRYGFHSNHGRRPQGQTAEI